MQEQPKKSLRERRKELHAARVLKARLEGKEPPKYGMSVCSKIKIQLHRLSNAELKIIETKIREIQAGRAMGAKTEIVKSIRRSRVGDVVSWESASAKLQFTIMQKIGGAQPRIDLGSIGWFRAHNLMNQKGLRFETLEARGGKQ